MAARRGDGGAPSIVVERGSVAVSEEARSGAVLIAPRPHPVVDTGFESDGQGWNPAVEANGAAPRQARLLLRRRRPGRPREHRENAVPVPSEELLRHAELAVTLHPVDGGVDVPDDARSACFACWTMAAPSVISQPAEVPRGALPNDSMIELWTGKPGESGWRSSIHHGMTLVQSRLVTARVVCPGHQAGRMKSELDYALATELVPQAVEALDDAEVSFMVNGSDDNHALQVLARDGNSGALHRAVPGTTRRASKRPCATPAGSFARSRTERKTSGSKETATATRVRPTPNDFVPTSPVSRSRAGGSMTHASTRSPAAERERRTRSRTACACRVRSSSRVDATSGYFFRSRSSTMPRLTRACRSRTCACATRTPRRPPTRRPACAAAARTTARTTSSAPAGSGGSATS